MQSIIIITEDNNIIIFVNNITYFFLFCIYNTIFLYDIKNINVLCGHTLHFIKCKLLLLRITVFLLLSLSDQYSENLEGYW